MTLILSESPTFRWVLAEGTYLIAFRDLAFQLFFVSVLVECVTAGGLYFRAYPLLTIHYALPQNKKPGVERRVQPPTLEWLHAMLDCFLACARKEPHYRIYFSAFA